jgi:hypothetical protein
MGHVRLTLRSFLTPCRDLGGGLQVVWKRVGRATDCQRLEPPGPARWRDPARMQSMGKTLTADDILPLVASLTPQERVRLLRLIALPEGGDVPVYRSVPPSRDEFSADDEPLAWDADGWEDVA